MCNTLLCPNGYCQVATEQGTYRNSRHSYAQQISVCRVSVWMCCRFTQETLLWWRKLNLLSNCFLVLQLSHARSMLGLAARCSEEHVEPELWSTYLNTEVRETLSIQMFLDLYLQSSDDDFFLLFVSSSSDLLLENWKGCDVMLDFWVTIESFVFQWLALGFQKNVFFASVDEEQWRLKAPYATEQQSFTYHICRQRLICKFSSN